MCCNHSHKKNEEDFAFCPVMKGMPVDKTEAEETGRVREYNSKKYYLCCKGCVNDFDTKPQIYAV